MKRFYKFLMPLVAIAALALPLNVQAQMLGDYTFSTGQDSTLWVDMSSATQILAPGTGDYGVGTVQDIGFVFPFGEDVYSQYSVNSDGNLKLGSTVTGTSYYSTPFNTSNANQNNPKINAFGCDGYGSTAHYVKALLVNNDMLSVEFCTGTYTSTTRENPYKWQVHLYQNGNIEIVFPNTDGLTAPAVAHQCGLCVDKEDGWVISMTTHTAEVFTNGSSTTNASGTWVDNYRYYSFTRPTVTCPKPLTIAATNLSTDGATIYWTAGDSEAEWELVVDSISYIVNDTFVTVSNLDANTIYTMQVRAICGDGDTSMFRNGTFRTTCAPLTTLPYEMDFDNEETGSTSSTDFIPCYTRFENASSYHYPYVYASYARSGKCLYWYWYNSTSYGTKYLVALPVIDTIELPINTLQLRFWARTYSTSTSGTFQVGVLTDLADENTFVPLQTISLNSADYAEYTVAFGDAPAGARCMAIKYLIPSTSTQYVIIDDVTIEAQPSCPPIIDLAVEGTTTSAALLSWGYMPGTPGVPENYVVSYINLDDSTATAVNATTEEPYIAINGLIPSTNYRFWVAPNCGTEDGMGAGDSIDFSTINFGCAVIDEASSFSDTIGNGTSTNNYLPSYSFYNYGYTQQIFTAAEIGHGGEITSLAFMMATVAQQRTYEIYLAHVDGETANEFLSPDDLTLVYDGGPVTMTANEWTTFNFTTPFVYDGSRNLLVVFRDMTGDYVSGNYGYVHTAASGASRYVYTDDGAYTPGAVTGGTSLSVRNNIIFAGAQCAQVATCAAPAAMVSDVDVDQVTVTWVPGASEDQWDLYYRVLGDTVWEEAAAGVSTTSYAYTNLLPGLTYEFRVVNDCSEGIFDDVVIGTTLCAAEAPLPLTENFQTRAYGPFSRSCWVTGSTELGTSYPYPQVVSLTGDSENKLCILTDGAYIILPKVAGLLSDLQISFKLTQGGDNVRFLMGLVPDQSSPINSMIVLDTLIRSNIDTSTSTVNITYVFDTISEEYNGYCVAFWDAFDDNYNFLDDIVLDYVPACSPVQSLSATATTTDATISWEIDGANASSYTVEYGPRGFARGTGTIITASSSPVTISGLSHSTNYDAYVYTECASLETTSSPSQVVQFTTQCDVVSTFPYVMNFENIMAPGSSADDVQPNCWIAETTNGGTVPHVYYTSSTNYAPSPSYCYYMYNLAVAALPQMSVPLNTLQVSFHEYNGSPNYYGLIIGAVSSDTNGFAASFEPIDTLVFEDGVYQYDVVSYLTDYNGTGNRIAFKNYYNGTSTYSYHYIDNLVVSLAPTCIAPQRVQLTSLTNTSADLAWYISQASNYNIEYGPAGFVPGTGVTVTSASRNVSLAGLAPATTYDVRIVGVCSDSDHSDTTVFSFTTMRAAPVTTLPYFCDFSDSTIANAWELVNDDDNKWFVGSAAYNGTTDTMGLYISDDNGATNNYTATVTFSYAYRSFQLDSGIIYGIAFDWRAHGEGNYDYLRAFLAPASGIMTAGKDPNGGTSSYNFSSAAAPAGWIDLGGKLNLQDNWQTIMEDAIEVNATGVYNLVFLWANDGSVVNQPPVAIDNVEVFVNTCPAPSSVFAVSAGTNTITVDWAGGAEATTWQLEYGPVNHTRGTGTIITTSTHPVQISGLESLTAYDVYVRSICTDADTGRWSKKATLSTTICDNAGIVENFDDSMTESTSTYSPIGYGTYDYSFIQYIIPANRLAGIQNDITALEFLPMSASNGDLYTNTDVYMANVSEDNLSSAFILPSDSGYLFTQVIDSGDFNFTEASWQTHLLDVPFTWDGHSNVLITVNRKHGDWSSSTSFRAHNDTVARMRYAYRDNNALDFSNVASVSSYTSTTVGDIRLIACGDACTAPVNLTADTSSYNSLTFNWNDGDSAEAVLMAGYWDDNAIATATSIVTTTRTATFTGLQPNEMYTVGVRTLCEESTSDWVTMTVHTADLPCEAPATVTVSATTFDGATVAWTAGTNATSWEVRVYNNTYDETYTTEQPTYTFTGLNEGTFNVSVRSICSEEISSEWSEPIQFTTESCVAPTGVTVSSITANSAVVSWTAAASSNGRYTMEYGFSGFSRGQGTTVEVTGTTYTITGLESEIEYDVYVASYCGENIVSPWTPVQSFTTIAGGQEETYTITVQSNNTAWGTVTGGGTYPAGTQVTLTATATSIGEFVEWQDGNTEAQRSIVVTGNATYTATFREHVGIDDVDGNAIALYPNPASTTVTIAGMELQSQIVIVDMNGREVYRATAADGSVKVDVSNLSKGAYFVRITGEKTNAIRKLVVK